MSTKIVPTRWLAVGGGLLATTGLIAAMATGPSVFADTATTTANADVTSTITLTGDTAFTITGAPDEAVTSTSALTAESNSSTGYNVTVLADQTTLVPADTTANTDVIQVADLKVDDDTGAATALDTTTAVTVHSQADPSVEGGDALTADYSLTMPFVTADTYSGGLTFTAAAN